MFEQTLRVTAIRSQSPKGFGGCIFTGKPIDDHGNVQDAAAILHAAPARGSGVEFRGSCFFN